ncbi:hypothetical protein [Kallotenue papyrolyticum]|uniref:hypothetical protein n=1 Tax=Kallotenue papyrolyticum TaxID=1325125 RepID=UPI00049290ED|nr:hypothetical protein [Kallotenue papyrolyticum]
MSDELRAALDTNLVALYRLALLGCGARRGAERAVLAVARQCLRAPSPTGDPELVLYRALWRVLTERHRRHVRAGPRTLRACTPAARLLLGLWLLQRCDGPRLMAITGRPPETLLAELAALLTEAQPPADLPSDEEHPDLRAWLGARLGWSAWPAAHGLGCRVCQTRRHAWEQRLAQWQAALTAAVAQAQLPAELRARLAALSTSPSERQRLPLALAGAVALLLVALMLPRPDAATRRLPPDPRQLISAALAEWHARPPAGVRYRQVWARSPWREDEALIADLWLSDAQHGQQRIEVRQADRLVEWQLGVGDELWYAAEPAYATCPWNTGWQGNWRLFERNARRFALRPGEAEEVLRAWLERSAYGQGYSALLAGQRADDLRSLGLRRAGAQTLVALTYTDRQAQPPAHIILWIDPLRHQLHRVQELTGIGDQRIVRDRWRLLRLREYRTGVPLTLPRWEQAAGNASLLDVACPALRLERVVSLRTLLATPWRWYVPQRLPTGLTRALLTAPILPAAPTDYTLAADSRILITGDGAQSLTLSAVTWREAVPRPWMARGAWLIDLPPAGGPVRRVTLRDARFPLAARAPTIDLWARSLSDAELLAVVDGLAPLSPATWSVARRFFLEPRPLAPEVAAVLDQALAASQPADQTVYLRARSEARQTATAESARLVREQWLRAVSNAPPMLREEQRRADGRLAQVMVQRHGSFAWYLPASGRVWSGRVEQLTPRWQPQPLDLELVLSLLTDAGALRAEPRGDLWLLEQVASTPPEQLQNARWSAPPPDLTGLPAGVIVRRLWLDRAQLVPLRLDTLHRDAQGGETPLLSIVIETRVPLATTAEALFRLPDDPTTSAGGMAVPPVAITEPFGLER